MKKLNGNILTPQGFISGTLEIVQPGPDDGPERGPERGRVANVSGGPIETSRVRDAGLPIVLPGFIDVHVHGGGGRDIMEGGDAAARVAEIHARHGTTSLLATTMTAPPGDLEIAFAGMRELAGPDGRAGRGARILGVHLEGPYINPGQLGAQPDYSRPLDAGELKRLHEVAPIRLITLAPEVPGHMEAIETLSAAGYRVQIGHSLATYEEGLAALTRGARGFTHLFNAMTGLHHRKPGLVGVALAHAEYAELIVDLLHVHPGAIRAALRAIPRVFCVTDSTPATGMPDGEYQLGRHTVTKCLGGVRLADGTLAGSALTMDQALRNLVNELGLDLEDASRRVSTNAADYLGLADRGRLQAGAWADIVVLDRDLNVTDVYIEGRSIEKTTAARPGAR